MGKGKKSQNIGDGEQSVEEEIVLKVYMHCEACVSKILNCLKGFEGIEEVKTDRDGDRVIVKGKKADPLKVLERLKKKYSRNVELISPRPKIILVNNNDDNKEPPKKQERPIEVVTLKMLMHCEGCANDIKRSIEKMTGILSVETNMKKSIVTIEGRFDESNIAKIVSQRLRKYAETMKVEKSKDNKEDEKGNKKEVEEVKSNDKGNGKDNKKSKEEVIVLSYPPQYSARNVCPNYIFSDENIFSCSIM